MSAIKQMTIKIEICDGLNPDLVATVCDWNTKQNPFINPQFLMSLELSSCVTSNSGWVAQHVLFKSGSKLLGFMPMYLKFNSSGEFVFDWDWARAYQEHGLDYYPKLITAIPFIPSVGPRLLHHSSVTSAQLLELWQRALPALLTNNQISGWHCLFADQETQPKQIENSEFIVRNDCQYHWLNQNYANFESFLARFKSRKRKQIKKERSKLKQQGFRFERVQGDQISNSMVEEFYQFYQSTYDRYGHQEHLNLSFFKLLREHQSSQLLLIRAFKDDVWQAAALCLFDNETLYGRYWGSHIEQQGLHFETCYYQGIEFCIENNLLKFDPGTQGQHKVVRGFEPTLTTSVHVIEHAQFRHAIDEFCKKERDWVGQYMMEANQKLPFSMTENESVKN
ncbi:GNAT family N-acetyltransferase [Alginatibacterium sediminis]|uniref:GNAT family N-acetyltransferase n=1 Tax=Alginatibacterium sediminis TaxID=2164068 RepID=A0A420EHC0_9ALTE|nr:GNAT family N-acetyltransferase [Alginatibacterium sediminis]RKF20105.1 GNAT family N-acetyltransferase [Alginatibacterium sediminis]